MRLVRFEAMLVRRGWLTWFSALNGEDGTVDVDVDVDEDVGFLVDGKKVEGILSFPNKLLLVSVGFSGEAAGVVVEEEEVAFDNFTNTFCARSPTIGKIATLSILNTTAPCIFPITVRCNTTIKCGPVNNEMIPTIPKIL